MGNRYFKKLKKAVTVIKRKYFGYPVIYNANKKDESKYSKRALVIYLVDAFRIKENDPFFRFGHQNLQQCKIIVSELDKCGYIVDVIDISDRKNIPNKKYDFLLTHSVDFTRLENCLSKMAIKIYFATGTEHIIHNQYLKKRLNAFQKRRNCTLTDLVWDNEELNFLKTIDAIISIGNTETANSWKNSYSGPIYPINNTGSENLKYVSKDFSMARNNFLFFGSRQQLGKGLDLLLEIFSEKQNLNLLICSSYLKEKDFCECYEKELFNMPNIHALNIVAVGSDSFYKLIEKCAFVILPSCSEGQAGSVIQCMWAGLIPIVTKETGITLEDFGMLIADGPLESVGNAVDIASKLPAQLLEELSKKARMYSEINFSKDSFQNRCKAIVNDVHAKKLAG